MLGRGIAALAVAAGIVAFGTAGAAQAAAPNILNDGAMFGTQAQWAESNGATHDSSNRRIHMTFLVQHDLGRRITQVAHSNGTTGVTAQYLGTSGTSSGTNRLATSVVRFSYDPGDPGGFSCGFGFTRRRSIARSFRVVDDGGQSSETLTQNVTFIRTDQCPGADDFAALEAVSQSTTNIAAGGSVTFGFTCDDADGLGTDDRCDRIFWRTRRLNDGVISGETVNDAEDDVDRTFSVNFPQRGIYVVEARLCGEDNCPDGSWWRIGGVQVNSSSPPTGDISFTGPVVASSPPSVNAGAAVTAEAQVGDSDGVAQVLEWDAQDDGTFERFEFTTPVDAGDLTTPALSSAQRSQAVSTTPGLKTLRIRVTDNGSLDAASNDRRTLTTSDQLRVNAIPVASGGSRTIAEDSGPGTFQLSAADSDNQPQALAYEVLDAPDKGTLSCSTGGQCTYSPAPNATGSDSFTFRARDGATGLNAAWSYSNTATYAINITPVNDAPSLGDVSVFTQEDQAQTTTVAAVDPDGPALSYAVDAQPAHGSATCTAGGTCTYTPHSNHFGTDSYVVRVNDGAGGTDTGTVSVNIASVNDAPVAGDLSLDTDEDTEVTFGLPVSDVDHPALAVTIVDAPDHGTVVCAATCTYQPALNYAGADSFVYEVADGDGARDTGTVSLTVLPVNDAPVAEDVDVSTDEDTPVDVEIVATDVDDTTLSYTVVQAPAHGTVQCSGAVCTYTPGANFFGTDSFEVRVSDGPGAADDAIVTVTINAVNDAPVAQDASVETLEDAAVTFAPPATDVDDAELEITAVDGAHGTVECAVLCTYTPDPDFNGHDQFVYTASDGELADTGTITVTVAAVNDPPVADAQTVSTDEDTPAAIQLTASDVDGDALTYLIAADPAHGAVQCDTNGACTYAPAPDFHGEDTFTFSATDGELTDTATVTITVTPVNDAPVAQDASVETLEDAAVTFAPPATDVDDAELEITAVDGAHGTVECAVLCTYTPDPDFNGHDQFVYTASDGELADTGTITVTVAAVNDPPVADAQTVSTDEDTPAAIQLTASDVDGDALTYLIAADPAHGAVQCDTNGACTYDPAPDFHGEDTFTFSATDGELTDTATVTITVTPVNDAPVAQDTSAGTDEDTAVDVTIPAADVDGDALAATASDPAHGSVSCAGLVCSYEPDPDYNGPDGFVATVTDPSGATAVSNVAVAIAPVNDAPVPDDLSVFVDEDASVAFTLSGSDVEGDALTFAVAPDAGPSHGEVRCDAGDCLYVPAPDFNGADALEFVVADGHGGTARGTVDITVRPVNDAPQAPDGTASVDEDGSVDITVAGSDPDGDALTYAAVAGPAHGSVDCTGAGVCTYRSHADYHGDDAFAYRATDPDGATATGTVRIAVAPVNDAPTAQDIAATTEEDTALTIALQGADVDGDLLDYAASAPAHGTLACEDALCTYTPAADYFGQDSFTYAVTDPSGASASATVSISIREIRHTSSIIVGPVVKSLQPLSVAVSYKAQLLRATDQAPIVGRSVTFVTGGQRTCTSTTGSDGIARCPWSISRSLAVLLDLGYDAVFEGDEDYTPVSGHGAIVGG